MTQDVFCELWRHPELFDPDRSALRPWLARHPHKQAVRFVRDAEAGRRRNAELHDLDEILASVVSDEVGRAAFAALPDNERLPIGLAYFGAKTYREVAAELVIDAATVGSRMRAGPGHMTVSLQAETAGREA